MFLRVEGKEAEGVVNTVAGFFTAASKFLMASAKKTEWESEAMEKRLPLTEAEIQKDLTISSKELENRERRAKIEGMELDAREQKALADRAEAILRQRTVRTRSESLNRANHKKVETVPGKPAGQSTERRHAVRGEEGKSLTQNLGDKLKSVATAS